MNTLVTITLGLISLTALVSAEYRWYFPPSYSCRALSKRLSNLQKEVDSIKKPVHVHVGGDHAEHTANLDGSHIHVHLSLDGQYQKQEGPVALKDEYSYASCYLQANSQNYNSVKGYVYMRQKANSNIEIKIELQNLPRDGTFGFHVHELTNYKRGCNSFGGHFNPLGKTHGGPLDMERHVGDWGNIPTSGDETINYSMNDTVASLFGPDSIVGRGIVLHAGVDDLGRGGNAESKKTGNAGPRLGCCVIGWDNENSWPLV